MTKTISLISILFSTFLFARSFDCTSPEARHKIATLQNQSRELGDYAHRLGSPVTRIKNSAYEISQKALEFQSRISTATSCLDLADDFDSMIQPAFESLKYEFINLPFRATQALERRVFSVEDAYLDADCFFHSSN